MLQRLFFIFLVLASLSGYGQVKDSIRVVSDSTRQDTITKAIVNEPPVLGFDKMLYFPKMSKWEAASEKMYIDAMPSASKDLIFYFFVGLALYFAFVKILFPRYVYNMFNLFFQANFRRKQTREQLQQDVFPAFLLNIFYILVASTLIAQIAILQGWTHFSFWTFGFYCVLILAAITFIKYIFIRIAGAVSGLSPVAEMYLFVVFLLNKLMGVVSMPLLLVLTFCDESQRSFLILAIASIVGLGLIFRYLLSYNTIRKNLKTTPLQFFVYLCVVEFLPFLVFYEILFNRIGYNF